MRVGALLILRFVAIGQFVAGAQTPSPRFDVASIRKSRPDLRYDALFCENGRYTRGGDTLKALIQFAWRLRDFQVIGGPRWADSDQFFIEAKGDPAATPEQCLEMMQALLEDRFRLAVHKETRQLPIYSLVVAPSGPKFHESAAATRPGFQGADGHLRAQKISMAILVQLLSRSIGPVQDLTGLTSRYDFTLEWTPENTPVADATGPSIFTAVQEQLGLKLESKTGPVEVLVIDHAEMPTEN